MKIFITTQFEGIHRWKDAPEEVAFLRDYHRHIFHVKVESDVEHEERQIEFILFKREVDKLIKSIQENDPLVKDWSCETWAKNILMKLRTLGYTSNLTCEVNEDGENGAVVSTSDFE